MPAYGGGERRGPADAGLEALRRAVLSVLRAPTLAGDTCTQHFDLLVAQAHGTVGDGAAVVGGDASASGPGATDPHPDADPDPDTEPDRQRMVALVRLSQQGDAEAFGQLYDRYVDGVYRFCYHRVSSVSLAEDLTSETFFRALRGIGAFRWQGRDFGAWLTTIARTRWTGSAAAELTPPAQ